MFSLSESLSFILFYIILGEFILHNVDVRVITFLSQWLRANAVETIALK